MWQSLKNIYHLSIAVLANIYFGFPGNKLKVIGVTGTDGKTTTVHLICHILKNSNKKVSMLSTITSPGLHVTTPSPFALQRILKEAKDKGSEFFVLEVTSHAIDQNRVWGIPFEAGAVTNITREHLDYHKTFENYVNTKGKLLKSAKIPIANIEDTSYKFFSTYKTKLLTYGLNKGDINLKNFTLQKSITGFNRFNFLCAASVCLSLGISKQEIKKAFSNFKLPVGRLDLFYDGDFKVIVDFAHTPNAFENVLKLLRPEIAGKIIHVFGSAGERDKEKRPLMGKISSKFSDLIVLTSEDPRRENPMKIINDIKSGIKNSVSVKILPNRKEAIRFSISKAKEGDLVLLTGKSHEKSMNYGKGEEPWDEYEVVEQVLGNK